MAWKINTADAEEIGLKSIVEGPYTAEGLGKRAEEAAHSTTRTSRFAQATYHMLLDIAQEIDLPSYDPDLRKSVGMYSHAEASPDDRTRGEYFSQANYYLSQAIKKHAATAQTANLKVSD